MRCLKRTQQLLRDNDTETIAKPGGKCDKRGRLWRPEEGSWRRNQSLQMEHSPMN